MRFFRQVLTVSIILFVIVGCRCSRRPNDTYYLRPSGSPQTPSLDDEAVQAVKDFWEQHTSKCGDSYYGFEDDNPFVVLHQYKAVYFVATRSGPNSEADKLNGILWNGVVQIKSGPRREKPQGREWSEWKQNQNLVEQVAATKRQSGWSVLQVRHITVMKRVTCSEVEL